MSRNSFKNKIWYKEQLPGDNNRNGIDFYSIVAQMKNQPSSKDMVIAEHVSSEVADYIINTQNKKVNKDIKDEIDKDIESQSKEI